MQSVCEKKKKILVIKFVFKKKILKIKYLDVIRIIFIKIVEANI